MQSVVSPVISTSLYFVVFGAAIGSRISTIEGVSYGAFIVPGLMMLMLLTQSVSNAAIGIYFPRFTGTIYEILSSPTSALEIVIGSSQQQAERYFLTDPFQAMSAGGPRLVVSNITWRLAPPEHQPFGPVPASSPLRRTLPFCGFQRRLAAAAAGFNRLSMA